MRMLEIHTQCHACRQNVVRNAPVIECPYCKIDMDYATLKMMGIDWECGNCGRCYRWNVKNFSKCPDVYDLQEGFIGKVHKYKRES